MLDAMIWKKRRCSAYSALHSIQQPTFDLLRLVMDINSKQYYYLDPIALTRDFYDISTYDDDSSDGSSPDLSSMASRPKGTRSLTLAYVGIQMVDR